MKNNKYIMSILITIFILLIVISGIYKCPIKLIFGLSCPFCGFTRAILSILNLEIYKSFHYHLLWPLIIIAIIIHILYEFNIIKKYKKQALVALYILVIINFIYYIYRLTNNSDIVYFRFNKSLIYKIYTTIFNK